MRMSGTPQGTKDWVRGYYAESTELISKNWAGGELAFHLGLDDGTRATRDETLAASNEYLANKGEIGEGTTVLDAGCGIGGSSLWLASRRRAKVVGITIAPEQVAMARRTAASAKLEDRAAFHEMDFAATTFEHGSFDVVWNIESMCHAFDKQEYLRHVFDLLRPGGRFVCLDMFACAAPDAPSVKEMCSSWSLPSLPSVPDVRGWLASLGFVDVESEDLTEQVRRPVLALQSMARNTSEMLRVEKAVLGSASAVYEAHVRGALACADGVEQGVMAYAYVGARKPDRGSR
jgi:ubiquinone/menaquinone biosynthesis C-methylase UbiE